MQRRVVLWITGAFHTSPTMEVEAITGLVPINLYLKKLYQRFHLQGFSLLPNHIIKSIFMSVDSNKYDLHRLYLESLTAKQKLKLRSPLIDMDNSCNEYILLFSSFNQEFFPRNRLINFFQINFSFTIILKKLRIISETSTTLLLKLLQIHLHLLSFQMLVSKIASLLQYRTSTHITSLLSRLFIELLMSPLLKWNYLL